MNGLFSEKTIAAAMAIVLSIAKALTILIVGVIVIKIVLGILGKALNKTRLDAALHTFMINTVKAVLWIIIIASILGTFGIPTGTFVAVLGACGAAVALALKDSLGNIAGGILILINKPFKKGDFIDIGGTTGVVDSIDLLVTILKTVDNKVVSVPNGTITTGILINYSREETRRVDCVFGIGYECSIGKAKDVISAVVDANSDILREPSPVIAVESQGDSSVNIVCRVWCKNSDYWDIKFYLEENVKIAFDEADINIPFPQMDVHVIK